MQAECFVAIGFDGTCVSYAYPLVGDDVGAQLWLRAATKLGANLILYTMRSGEGLSEAIGWFGSNHIELWNVNINPPQGKWTSSPKIHRHICIDDQNLCTPLVEHGGRKRMVVDWDIAGPELLRRVAGILNQ